MKSKRFDRRGFLTQAVKLTAGGVALPLAAMNRAQAAAHQPSAPRSAAATLAAGRALAFDHTHTRERINLVYAIDG